MEIRTRIAPSPTGYAHLGLISRILINYALAKKNNGVFYWRDEDTDTERFIPDALEFNMRWAREFGLSWDEGPDIGGPYEPYSQTKRLPFYQKASEKLLENGYAYRCFCTKERLEELRKFQSDTKQRTRYDGLCRNLSEDEIQKNLSDGKSFTIRIKMPENRKIEFDDIITHNHIVWDSSDVDDYIIMKSNGIPTYHLAAMVDDVEMKTTHLLRGPEWIPTTPVHLMVFEGLGLRKEEIPPIGHFTVILDPATPGKKFSKRNNSFKANGLVIKGYLKSAILNYLMLLGWAPKDNREIYTLEEFIEAFDLAGMQKANPTWNQQKMDWFNGVYIRNLSEEEFVNEFLDWIEKYLTKESRSDVEGVLAKDMSIERMDQLIEFSKTLKSEDKNNLIKQVALIKERTVHFWQALQQIEFFYKAPQNINWEIKQLSTVSDRLAEIKNKITLLIQSLPDDSSTWTHEEWEAGMRKISDEMSAKHGDIFMVLRVAVTGEPFSPPLFEALQILGKEEVLKRLKA